MIYERDDYSKHPGYSITDGDMTTLKAVLEHIDYLEDTEGITTIITSISNLRCISIRKVEDGYVYFKVMGTLYRCPEDAPVRRIKVEGQALRIEPGYLEVLHSDTWAEREITFTLTNIYMEWPKFYHKNDW